MYIYTYRKLQKKNKVSPSLKRVGVVATLVLLYVCTSHIGGTNAYFTDRAEINSVTFSAGVWIPTLTMTVTPESPDGTYDESPCVKLHSDIDDVTIYYVFETGSDEVSETVKEDECIYPPEGESDLTAYAVNERNDAWKSEKISEEFHVRPKVASGSVVINEIMWMGSFRDEKDEWIELRNMTDDDIDLSGWRIDNAGRGKNGHIQIPHGYIIRAHEYFLITRKKWDETQIAFEQKPDKDRALTHVSGMHLIDRGEGFVLRDHKKNVIDKAWKDKKWPDGYKGLFLHMSMERSEDPRDGQDRSDWHTCTDRTCNDTAYWHREGLNFGTPGSKNSQKNLWFDRDDSDAEHDLIERHSDDESVLREILQELEDENDDDEKMNEHKVKKDDDKDETKDVEKTIPQEKIIPLLSSDNDSKAIEDVEDGDIHEDDDEVNESDVKNDDDLVIIEKKESSETKESENESAQEENKIADEQ